MFQSHKPFYPDESTGELCVLCHFLVIHNVYLQPDPHYSLCSLFQALASHRAYLLTARIPTKVGATTCFLLKLQ